MAHSNYDALRAQIDLTIADLRSGNTSVSDARARLVSNGADGASPGDAGKDGGILAGNGGKGADGDAAHRDGGNGGHGGFLGNGGHGGAGFDDNFYDNFDPLTLRPVNADDVRIGGNGGHG